YQESVPQLRQHGGRTRNGPCRQARHQPGAGRIRPAPGAASRRIHGSGQECAGDRTCRMTINADDILAATTKVPKKWTKQRKAEARNSRARWGRSYVYSARVDFTDVADDILPAGYAHASGNGRYTVDKRQFYYRVRQEFLNRTGRELKASYFSQTLLVKYMNQHPEETAAWKVTASSRGTLTIPNTGWDTRIPCGTVAIEEHLAKAARPC